ncbi:MAG: class I SAM-dependent methyltransferase [Acidiferrobacterales bacterium]
MTEPSFSGRHVFQEAARCAGSLPTPSEEECAHGDRLVAVIREEISACGGSIDFARFMELALYAPELGYYRRSTRKFGEAGDFITAPELSPVFAHCLARQCQQVIAELGGGDIIEVGAGSGVLCVDLLRALEHLDCLPDHYYILEVSAALKHRQRELINRKLPHLATCVEWLAGLSHGPLQGVVLGNEVLDSMPVHRFRVSDDGIRELRVTWRDDRFAWIDVSASQVIDDRVQPLALPRGYNSEIGLHAEAWVRSVGRTLTRGVLLLIDYGFPRTEFYHPQRHEGTLMCHYRHRSHDNPLILVGLQDITAHVDFSAIAQAGREAGLSLFGYTSQAAFLLSSGLDDTLAAHDPDGGRAHLELMHQVDRLTSPAQMGELHKVIALGRSVESRLLGFSMQDRRSRLALA